MMPPQFEGMSWVNFTPSGNPLSQAESASAAQQQQAAASAPPTGGNLDDMDMDDMFVGGEEGAQDGEDENDNDYDDYIDPSVRYKAVDEEITQEDLEMLMGTNDEVEMVEDVGSLAQSMGLSHMGRSLQLQAEIASRNQRNNYRAPKERSLQQGVTVGGELASAAPRVGGIGGAMEQARVPETPGLGDSFYQKRPISAPRLDSFKMVKVVGKGSCGKLCRM
jgi:hypothetical protein